LHSILVVAEVENFGATNELYAVDISNVNGVANSDTNVNADSTSEVDAAEEVDDQSGPRGGGVSYPLVSKSCTMY
jgi:hypothetical protein